MPTVTLMCGLHSSNYLFFLASCPLCVPMDSLCDSAVFHSSHKHDCYLMDLPHGSVGGLSDVR